MMTLLLLLAVVFIVLKITNNITWDWWIVLLPAIIWVVIKLLV